MEFVRIIDVMSKSSLNPLFQLWVNSWRVGQFRSRFGTFQGWVQWATSHGYHPYLTRFQLDGECGWGQIAAPDGSMWGFGVIKTSRKFIRENIQSYPGDYASFLEEYPLSDGPYYAEWSAHSPLELGSPLFFRMESGYMSNVLNVFRFRPAAESDMAVNHKGLTIFPMRRVV